MDANEATRDAAIRAARFAISEPQHEGQANEYYARLLLRAIDAKLSGNYGISAALSARRSGHEVVLFGSNELASGHPQAHAEMTVIELAANILARRSGSQASLLDRYVRQGDAIVRDTSRKDGVTLYSTLEPCPMCTVAIINAGINHVVYAREDPIAGGLAAPRLSALAPLWESIAKSRGMRVEQTQSTNQDSGETYVSGPLNEAIATVFEESRRVLDDRLEGEGFFNASGLVDIAQALHGSRGSDEAHERPA